MADKIFSFEDLNKEMAKISELGDIMDISSVSAVDHYIHSGNYNLNACITGSLNRGYPNNRAVAIAGPPGSGKTYLLLNAIRNAQKMGYYIIFYDSENAVDKDLVVKFGIDPTKFRYEPVGTIQEFRTSVTQLTEILIQQKKAKKEIPQILIALDSAGSLPTDKEIEDSLSSSDKADFTRAKVFRSIFRIIVSRLAKIKAPFLFTNHIYDTQSFISQSVAGGGKGPEYAASIILFLTKAQLKEGDLKTGIIVSITPNKNRFSVPHKIKIHINFYEGMNEYVGLEQYIDWETCGIAPGKIIDVEELNKFAKKIEKEKNDKKRVELSEVYTAVNDTCYEFGESTISIERYRYYVTKDQAKIMGLSKPGDGIAVKHLGETITDNRFFTSDVFTPEVIEMIDEKKVRGIFEYKGADGSIEEINNFFGEDGLALEDELDKSEPNNTVNESDDK